MPHAHNKFAVHYRAREGGAARVHVHLVDTDTMNCGVAHDGRVLAAHTTNRDVELSLGKAATKRTPTATLNRPKSFGLVSSDENVLRPRDGNARVTIPPNGVEHLRLISPPCTVRGMLRAPLLSTRALPSEYVFLLRSPVAFTAQRITCPHTYTRTSRSSRVRVTSAARSASDRPLGPSGSCGDAHRRSAVESWTRTTPPVSSLNSLAQEGLRSRTARARERRGTCTTAARPRMLRG